MARIRLKAMKIGLIGGSGVYHFAESKGGNAPAAETISIETPFGDVVVVHAVIAGRDVFFLNRHGKGHRTPPHLINYRANIHALKLAGVTRVIATSAVGTMNPAIKPGDFVLLDSFLDFTKGRAATFSNLGDVFHVDMGEPFCEDMRGAVVSVSRSVKMHERGIYVCAEGPRFETPAEIRTFRLMGGDVVGMTAVPECVLAREAGLCYAGIAVATNWAAGISTNPLTPDEVNAMMAHRFADLRRLIERAISAIPETRNCACAGACEKGRVRP
ncbi:MAG: MTAP family purine nucleoside phosphorylase [bacterium]